MEPLGMLTSLALGGLGGLGIRGTIGGTAGRAERRPALSFFNFLLK